MKTTASFRVFPWSSIMAKVYGAVAIAGSIATAPLVSLVSAVGLLVPLLFIGYAAFIHPYVVELGAEGLLIRRFGKPRYLAYEDIATISALRPAPGKKGAPPMGIELAMKDRSTIRFATSLGKTRDARRVRDEVIDAVREKLTQIAAWKQQSVHEMLARGELGLDEWKVRIQSLATDPSDAYRSRAISTDALWEILEDATADASARAAAALLLRKGNDRDRIRVAADACVSPSLRESLMLATEDAEDEADHWERVLKGAD